MFVFFIQKKERTSYYHPSDDVRTLAPQAPPPADAEDDSILNPASRPSPPSADVSDVEAA